MPLLYTTEVIIHSMVLFLVIICDSPGLEYNNVSEKRRLWISGLGELFSFTLSGPQTACPAPLPESVCPVLVLKEDWEKTRAETGFTSYHYFYKANSHAPATVAA